MLVRLLLLFTIIPLVDLALLLWIGEHTAWWFALLLVLVTGVVGAWLARHEGIRCMLEFRRRVSRGELPTDALMDGVLILVAGALLVTPGVLTDAVGLALLLPPSRRLIREAVKRRIRARVAFYTTQYGGGGGPPRRDEIIDVRVIDGDDRPGGEEP